MATPSATGSVGGPFELQITFESDWHVGTGSGRPGDVDRLVRRDEDGVPFVPAKTLTGVWRDGCERAAQALDSGRAGGPWQAWVDFVFGDQPALGASSQPPRPASLEVRAARASHGFLAAVAGRPLVRDALTFVKAGVSIDAATGKARDRFLRFEEMARGGMVLSAPCRLAFEGTPDQHLAAQILLLAGAALVERLGGKRRRGAGRCTLKLEDAPELASWTGWLEKHLVPLAPPVAATPLSSVPRSALEGGAWLEVPFQLEALSPLVVPAASSGNTGRTLDYVPGGLLLPVVARTLSGLLDLRGAIARGDLVVTNATIEVEGEAGRAVPLSLFQEKAAVPGSASRLVNRLAESLPLTQLKQLRSGYVGPTRAGQFGAPSSPDVGLTTHNVIDDARQRPDARVGGLYSYQHLAAGTKLRGALRLRESLAKRLAAVDPAWHERLATDEWRVGRAKKDEYGRVRPQVEPPRSIPPPPGPGRVLTLWLLSDLLLRNERLGAAATPLDAARALGELLGVKLKVAPEGDHLAVVARRRRHDGWQVRWGLPRPSLTGLAAGSCLRLEVVEGTIRPESVADLVAGGLGERRAEGFGQVAIDDPLVKEPAQGRREPASEVARPASAAVLVSKDDPGFGTARVVERAAWRAAIGRGALRAAAGLADGKPPHGWAFPVGNDGPGKSQLGALRSAVAAIRTPEDGKQVVSWLAGRMENAKRKEKWRRTRKPVEELLSRPDKVWELLGLDQAALCVTEGATQQLRQELWGEAVRGLLGAAMRVGRGKTGANEGRS